MICKECKNSNKDDALFCLHCGAALQQQSSEQKKRQCKHCGTQNSRESRYCVNCGTDLRHHPPKAASKEQRWGNKSQKRKLANSGGLFKNSYVLGILLGTGAVIVLLFLYYVSEKTAVRPSEPMRLFEQRSNDPAVEATVTKIASKFICSCGTCGEKPLEVCTCDIAIQERQFIRTSLQSGQSVPQVIASVKATFGWMKPEFASQYDSSIGSTGDDQRSLGDLNGKGAPIPQPTVIQAPKGGTGLFYPPVVNGTAIQRIATPADRAEIFSHFNCPCGQCGVDELKDCNCRHPRGATEVKAFVDKKIAEKRYTIAQLIEMTEQKYGRRKF